MNTGNDDQMDPRAALDQARRMESVAQRRGRWHGWVWLAIGLITPIFLIGAIAEAVSRPIQFWIAISFMVVGATLAIWEARRGLWGREAAKVDRPFTWAYVAAMVAVLLVAIILDPSGPPTWYVALALVPSVPCFIAAWRVLTR